MSSGIVDQNGCKFVTADNRGRIVLGADAKAQTFAIKRNTVGDYILTPMVQVPAREAWLSYENESRASFERGIADIASGRVREVDFAQYLSAEDRAEAEEEAGE